MSARWFKRFMMGIFPVALLIPTAGLTEKLPVFDCVIEPSMVVELSSSVDGVIEQVFVDRGDRVEANQMLVKLESGLEQAALNYARERSQMNAEIRLHKASLAYGIKNQRRITELQEKKLVSLNEGERVRTEAEIERHKLQQARENKRLAELELARATEIVKQHAIRSPIDGVVVERYLNPGESVEDRPVLKLAQIDPLRVEVVLPVAQFGKIRTRQVAVIVPEAGIGRRFKSAVSTVDSVLDAASGTFRVRLLVPNPDNALTSGLRCRIQFKNKLVAAGAKGPNGLRMAGN